MPKEAFLKGLMGSTAMPLMFLPVEYEDKILVDGGVAWNLDIASAIDMCKSFVDLES
jgi:predicted patatin/cPLA2 family phospholipase